MTIKAHGEDAWRVWVYAGTDIITGKPRRITKVVRGTHRDAELAEAALLLRHARKAGTGARTFGQAVHAYLDHKTLHLEQTTMDTYRQALAYIPETLMTMPLQDVGVDHIEAFYAHLMTKGAIRTGRPLGASAISNIHKVVKGTFDLAKRRKWTTENPAAEAEKPSIKRREPSPTPSSAVVELMRLAAAVHEGFPAYVRVAACAGARRSEVHGLRWAGVDWDRGRVRIRDVIVRAGGEWVVKPYPKTGGQRVVVIDQGTLAALRAMHVRALDLALTCGVALPDSAFVFTHEIMGETTWVPTTTCRWFGKVCRAAGVTEGTRVHDLRHMMATYLIDEGLPIPAVSHRLGHGNSNTTMGTYAAPVPKSDEVAAEIMGRLLDG